MNNPWNPTGFVPPLFEPKSEGGTKPLEFPWFPHFDNLLLGVHSFNQGNRPFLATPNIKRRKFHSKITTRITRWARPALGLDCDCFSFAVSDLIPFARTWTIVIGTARPLDQNTRSDRKYAESTYLHQPFLKENLILEFPFFQMVWTQLHISSDVCKTRKRWYLKTVGKGGTLT